MRKELKHNLDIKIVGLLLILMSFSYAQDLVIVNFSEAMDSSDLFNPENYVIEREYEVSTVIPLSLTNVYAPPVISVLKPAELPYDSLVYVYCITGEHIPGTYAIYVTSVTDLAGNEIEDKNFAVYNYGDIKMTNKVDIK